MTGSAGQRRVPDAFLRELRVPLPPVEEQQRIAAILDAADDLRAKRRESLALLDPLTESIFLDMFGDPVTNPMGWPEDRVLGEIAEIVSGITKGRRLNGQETRAVPYLAVVNVQDGRLEMRHVKTIDATEAEIARYRLMPGDLLLTEGGDPDKLGRGTIWSGELPECIHQNHVFRVRILGDYEPLFASRLAASERGRRYFLRSAKQTTGIASINKRQLAAFPLLTPPRELQSEFVAQLAGRSAVGDRLGQSMLELDALFASLQHRAFRGDL
jgi:type I restriction enzyme, S subunit